ncbi:MAG: polysaccharide pyruvyl transferase family protein [Gemmatimonadota bacterium]
MSASPGPPRRIVVENGSYFMDNLGDVAMLQACVGRIRTRWPDARVQVVVETPDRLRDAVPGVEPLAPAHGHRIPMTARSRHRWVVGLERRLQLHAPGLAHRAKRRQIAPDAERVARYDAFHAALEAADAVVCTGGGFVNDHHPAHAEKTLHTLGIAQALGRPTAMFGAGLGPLTDPAHRALTRPVIRRLDVLGLRERAGNLEELNAWGALPAAASRVFFTGDDAVELARAHATVETSPETPDALGVSLRLAGEYGRHGMPWLEAVVREFRRERGAPLVGLPVRTALSPENDVEALRTLLGAEAPDLEDAAAIGTPAQLLRRVRRCRVVLTGTYHAGVFALSLGKPIVTLSGSVYYDRKFAGLAEQFGSSAVKSFRHGDPDLAAGVRRALDDLWEAAPDRDAALAAAARSQVERGREAYEAFFRLVEGSS